MTSRGGSTNIIVLIFTNYSEICFPPALLKLRAVVEGAIIPLCHQGCIAINTRGATLYGTKRILLRRMIMHVQHHEQHLLAVLAKEITPDMDPLDAFLQARPSRVASKESWLLVL